MIESVKEMKPKGLLVKAVGYGDEFKYIIEDENNEVIQESSLLKCSANLTCFFGMCHAISILEEGEYEPYIHTNNMTALWWIKKRNVNSNVEDPELISDIEVSINYLEELEMDYECLHLSWREKRKFYKQKNNLTQL